MARLFPSRLGSEPLWMWECGCRRLWALLDTRRRCTHGSRSPQRLAVVQVNGLFWGCGWDPRTAGCRSEQGSWVFPPPFIEPVIFLHGRGIRETPGRIPQHYGATHCRQREYKRTDTGRAPGGLGSPLLEPLINFSATYFIDRQTRRCFLLPDM